MPQFLILGAAHLDRIGRFVGASVSGASNPGHVDATPGGAAFNVASDLAALGAHVSLATITGKDDAASILRQAAQARGFEMSAQETDHPTATYNAFLEPDGKLTIALADMAIYEAFDPQAVISLVESLGGDDWLVVDANLMAEHLATVCLKAKCRIAALSTSKAKVTRLRSVLQHIDLLITNRTEFDALSKDASELLCDLRTPNLVITDSDKMVMVFQNGQQATLPVPKPVMIADVIGAGDAFAAMVLLRHMLGDDLRAAASEGIRAAQIAMATDGPWNPQLSTLAPGHPNHAINDH